MPFKMLLLRSQKWSRLNPITKGLSQPSRLSIPLENFNLDLQKSPHKIGPWWVAHVKFSISIGVSNPGGRS